MSIIKNKFSDARISLLRQFLINNAQNGNPADYEIFVDELKVVGRTNDPHQFDNYEDFLTGETRDVTVVRYDGKSRRNTRHIFSFKEETKQENNPLSGIDIDKMVEEKLAHHKRQWEFEQLKNKNEELVNQISEAEEFIRKQSKTIEELKEKRKFEDREFGEIASVVVENLVRRNTHLLKKVPGMEGLAGFIEKDNQTSRQQSIPTEEASLSKNANAELNEEQKVHLEILKQMQNVFSNENLEKVLNLSKIFIQKPKAIDPTVAFAEQWKETENLKANGIENNK